MGNCNLDFIGEVYRNASVALQSINDIMDKIEDNGLKAEIQKEYEGYESFISELTSYMTEKGYEIKDIGAMKKAMMWSAINMNTAFDQSKSHISQIMVKGTVMGITELIEIKNGHGRELGEKTKEFLSKLLNLEEEYEQRLKQLL
jgi:DNA-binding CsgD family transcriptional regulator